MNSEVLAIPGQLPPTTIPAAGCHFRSLLKPSMLSSQVWELILIGFMYLWLVAYRFLHSLVLLGMSVRPLLGLRKDREGQRTWDRCI